MYYLYISRDHSSDWPHYLARRLKTSGEVWVKTHLLQVMCLVQTVKETKVKGQELYHSRNVFRRAWSCSRASDKGPFQQVSLMLRWKKKPTTLDVHGWSVCVDFGQGSMTDLNFWIFPALAGSEDKAGEKCRSNFSVDLLFNFFKKPQKWTLFFFIRFSLTWLIFIFSLQAIIHPDTGEKILMPFRMSGTVAQCGLLGRGRLTALLCGPTRTCPSAQEVSEIFRAPRSSSGPLGPGKVKLDVRLIKKPLLWCGVTMVSKGEEVPVFLFCVFRSHLCH